MPLEEPASALEARPTNEHKRRRSIWIWACRRVVPLILTATALVTSSTVTLLHGEQLSPIDEWVYVDYLYKIPEQGIVLKGDPIGEDALEIMACKGVTPYGPMGAPCGSDYNYEDFPFGGITSADAYTPIYFVTTWAVGNVIRFVTGVDEVTGWRLTSPLWFAAAMWVLSALFARWRVAPLATIAIGIVFIGSPYAYWTYSYVSTDAPAFLFGALLLLLTTRYLRGEIRGWWIVLVGVAATLIKITNVLGVGLAVLVVLVHLIMEWVRGRRNGVELSFAAARGPRLIATAAVTGVASIASQVAWLAVNAATAISDSRAEQGISHPLAVQELLGQTVNFLPGTIVSNVNIAGSDGFALPIPGFATAPMSWLCIAGVIGAFFLLGGRGRMGAVVLAVVVAAATFAPALALALQVVTGSYFALPPRYGGSILPGFLLLAGFILRNRWAAGTVLAYGAAMCGVLVIGAALLGPHFSTP